MAGELVSMSSFTPPEAKFVDRCVKGGGLALLCGIGYFGFKAAAPDMLTTIGLAEEILANAWWTLASGVGLFVACVLAYEALSPNGKINHLIKVPYWAAINYATQRAFEIDPLSPIKERMKQVEADKANFETQFEKLDGLISNIDMKRQKYEDAATKSKREFNAATAQAKKQAADLASSNFGRYTEAAKSYAQVRDRLIPVRATFKQISEACDFTAQKLQTEMGILADKWAIQKDLDAAGTAASNALGRSKSQLWQDALQCEDIIDTKYGQELGHIEHLKQWADPFLESIDVEKGVYSQEMLEQVQSSSTQLIGAATGAQPLALGAPTQTIAAPAAYVDDLMR